MVTIYFLSRKQPTNSRLRISRFNGTYEGFGVNYGKTLFVWICPVIFLLILKDFMNIVMRSSTKNKIKGY